MGEDHMDSHMHEPWDSDSEMPQREAAAADAGEASSTVAPAKSGAGGLRGFFKVPEKSKATKRAQADMAGANGKSGGANSGHHSGNICGASAGHYTVGPLMIVAVEYTVVSLSSRQKSVRNS